MARRDKRGRETGRLGTTRGERYALIPQEVMGSAAYIAQPDFAKVVMFALAARYHGGNNGDLSLTISDSKSLGVVYAWKLYAGLGLLKKSDLIVCTRQGRLDRGRKLCSLYAITWKGIDPSPEKVAYDASVSPSALPSHAWVKWIKPDDWAKTVREVSRANHGRSAFPVSTTLGNGRSTTLGKEEAKTDQPRWVKEPPFSVPTMVDTSKTLATGSNGQHPDMDIGSDSTLVPPPKSGSKTQTAKLRNSKSNGEPTVNLATLRPRGRA